MPTNLHHSGEKLLTPIEAYRVMLAFLEGYYDRTQSDDVATLLGELALTSDGRSMDPAAVDDWMNAVKELKGKKE